LPDTLIAALRRRTASHHDSVEVLLGLDAGLDLAHYGRVLQGFDCFLSVWEANVAQSLPLPLRPWFSARCRGHLVRRDLAALGLDPGSPTQVPRIDFGGLSGLMGSMYVMEGSALGGQVIARQVSQRFGLHAGNGAAYFNGFGSRTGDMWREFQGKLNTHDVDGADHDRACRAACHTFDALVATFTRVLHANAFP
jgi:heme oxygenase